MLSGYRRRQAEKQRQKNLFRAANQPSPEVLRARRQLQDQKAAQAQKRISKIRSIFEATPDHIKPNGSVELQDWIAFAICITFVLFVVHFFVGWWTILGGLIISVNGLLFSIEIQQKELSIPGNFNLRIPPSLVHSVSILLQLVLLYIWLPHWISIATQLVLCGSAIYILHKLRNPSIETIFTKRK